MQEYELRNWEIRERGQWPAAYGNVYGNPGFRDGYRIHTSSLMGYEVQGDALRVYTCHSTYLCRKEEFNRKSSWEKLGKFLGKYAESEKMSAALLKEITEEAARAERRESALTDADAAKGNCVVLYLDAIAAWYYSGMMVRTGKRTVLKGRLKVHRGIEHSQVTAAVDSGISRDPDMREISFSWYPLDDNRILFFGWPTPLPELPVYIKNRGDQPLELDTPCGQFLVPGGTLIRPDARNTAYRVSGHPRRSGTGQGVLLRPSLQNG